MNTKMKMAGIAVLCLQGAAFGAVISSGSGSVGIPAPTSSYASKSAQSFALGQWEAGVVAGAEISIVGTMTMSDTAYPSLWDDRICFGISAFRDFVPSSPTGSNWGFLLRVPTVATTNASFDVWSSLDAAVSTNMTVASANRQINYAMNLTLGDTFNVTNALTNAYTIAVDFDNNGFYDYTHTGTFRVSDGPGPDKIDRLRFGMGVIQTGGGRPTAEALTNNYTYVIRDHFISLTNSAPPAESQLIAGWTKAGPSSPSEKHPSDSALQVSIESSVGVKTDRGCTDLTYGSGLYTNAADEVSYHASTSCYSLTTNGLINVVVSNAYTGGSLIQLDALMADWTAPFSDSPKTISMTYVEGDLGIATNTLVASQLGTTSGLIGPADYSDVDASFLSYDVADRTLAAGEYAVFEITATGGSGAIYVDNIGLGATVSLAASGFDIWTALYGLSSTNALDTANPDGDRYNNLYEYGLGGDPTNSGDTGYAVATATMEASGTNYFEYVHVRRTSENNGLTYTLEQDNDLVAAPGWIYSGDYTIVGTNSMPSDPDFEAVTNWISTEGKSAEFIKLIIE